MRKCVLLAFVLPGALGIVAQAADDRAPRTLMIADFEDDTVLGQISTSGVSVALTEQDAVSGRHALEVRVRPFSVHNNHWPRVVLEPLDPLDLCTYSKVIVTIRNVTEGLPPVKLSMTSLTYNDGGRNWDDRVWYIPEGESMVCEFPVAAIRRHMNDPSSIRMLMFVFPDNEIDAVQAVDWELVPTQGAGV